MRHLVLAAIVSLLVTPAAWAGKATLVKPGSKEAKKFGLEVVVKATAGAVKLTISWAPTVHGMDAGAPELRFAEDGKPPTLVITPAVKIDPKTKRRSIELTCKRSMLSQLELELWYVGPSSCPPAFLLRGRHIAQPAPQDLRDDKSEK